MRVSPELSQKLQELSAQRTSRTFRPESAASAGLRVVPGSSSEEFQVSPELRLIRSLYDQVIRLPEFDEEKVRLVAERLREGSYSVDAQSVAEALLEELAAH